MKNELPFWTFLLQLSLSIRLSIIFQIYFSPNSSSITMFINFNILVKQDRNTQLKRKTYLK